MFFLSEYSRFSTLDLCLRCLLLFVYDALLYSAQKAALAAIAESLLLRISLLSLSSCFDCFRRA
jgi:hypothetical protein